MEKEKEPKKERLLLHICCIGCGVFVMQELQKDFDVVLYFYNPNIFPEQEYDKRLEEIKKVSDSFKFDMIIDDYAHIGWLQKVRGSEEYPEGGKRCFICYEDRLKKTAEIAKERGFDYFCTTLTTSPHKKASLINEIGKRLEDESGVKFLEKDFKKCGGFQKAAELSRDLGLYRQNYCGCEFSLR